MGFAESIFPSSEKNSTQTIVGKSLTVGKQGNVSEYDAVFSSSHGQKDVYKNAVGTSVCENIFSGVNMTVLSYGQTGSGKTYTMGTAMGSIEDQARSTAMPKSSLDPNDDLSNTSPSEMENSFSNELSVSDDDGICVRAVYDLFKAKKSYKGSISVALTYLELHNDEIKDLLGEGEKHEQLKIQDLGDNGVVVKGLTSIMVHSPEHAILHMRRAASKRTTGATNTNSASSRSHAVAVFNVTVRPLIENDGMSVNQEPEIIHTKLTLVDLAGSERIKQSGVEGFQQQESININKDLFVLGQVISSLAQKNQPQTDIDKVQHVPYRDSKLTRLLRDSFGGNCYTILIACISPAEKHLSESMNTLRYAKRTQKITNRIVQNIEFAPLSKREGTAIRRENAQLRARLSEFEQLANVSAENIALKESFVSTEKSLRSAEIREQERDKTILQLSQSLGKITTEARSLAAKFEAKIIENVNALKSLTVTKSSLRNAEAHGQEQDRKIVQLTSSLCQMTSERNSLITKSEETTMESENAAERQVGVESRFLKEISEREESLIFQKEALELSMKEEARFREENEKAWEYKLKREEERNILLERELNNLKNELQVEIERKNNALDEQNCVADQANSTCSVSQIMEKSIIDNMDCMRTLNFSNELDREDFDEKMIFLPPTTFTSGDLAKREVRRRSLGASIVARASKLVRSKKKKQRFRVSTGSMSNRTNPLSEVPSSDSDCGPSNHNTLPSTDFGDDVELDGDIGILDTYLKSQTQSDECICTSSLKCAPSKHVEFFLPKLACKCGRYQDDSNENRSDLSTILHEWQVEFLRSAGIETTEGLIIAYKTKARKLCDEMIDW
eukprot:CAMPEP_0194356782 /NCGR_PEP_ID=MMETSP0174-20130528/4354_1 /TAXON_ID=216777 /ORGANISM="Proboscia alata, Strain PI-D3" /LENGTH=849 /DNA_ID=CAMNT_0039126511 /DNA_START=294 /DNA_END=2840 /DNA_ORIENTATION=-